MTVVSIKICLLKSKCNRWWKIVFLLVLGMVYASSSCREDFNRDGVVDFQDFLMFIKAYRDYYDNREWNRECDLDSSGGMGFEDLAFAA